MQERVNDTGLVLPFVSLGCLCAIPARLSRSLSYARAETNSKCLGHKLATSGMTGDARRGFFFWVPPTAPFRDHQKSLTGHVGPV